MVRSKSWRGGRIGKTVNIFLPPSWHLFLAPALKRHHELKVRTGLGFVS